ncbi:hypothetical protein L228DRAFT_243100 [Xylona heveae TC161]|uniref:DUF4211 domain-containing protein n=1 Tax=Xylona heveae (strain CBS 132557 / TC161) TaxID=1328760 RepID=A0A165JTN7_XYLHT|nr:hypothetical protein L228DRAFT_243100 [Xylona heveae TC161]KZF26613.1 hypothetical protein L228DRAFT_243100 [Xylona heveae TC161]
MFSSSSRPPKQRQTRLSFAQPSSSPTARLPARAGTSHHPPSSPLPARKSLRSGTLDRWRNSIMDSQRTVRRGREIDEREASPSHTNEIEIKDEDDEIVRGPSLDLDESSDELSLEPSRMNEKKRRRMASSSSSPEPAARKRSKSTIHAATNKEIKEHRSPFGAIKSNRTHKSPVDSDDSDNSNSESSPSEGFHWSDAIAYSQTTPKRANTKTTPLKPPRNSLSFLSGGSTGAAPLSHSQRSSRHTNTPSKRLKIAKENIQTPKITHEDAVTPSRSATRRIVLSSDDDDESESERISGSEHTGSEGLREEAGEIETGGKGPDGESSEGEVQVIENVRKNDSDAEGSDAPPSSAVRRGSKRRLINRSKKQVVSDEENDEVNDQEAEDLKEDLEDLQGNRVQRSRTRGRAHQSSTKSKLQQTLEKLRRRRAGGRSASAPDEADYDSQSDNPTEITNLPAHLQEDDDQEDDYGDDPNGDAEEEDHAPKSHARSSRHKKREDLDTYEEDFVVDDADDMIGAPEDDGTGLYDMPIEFTRHAHKSLKQHFKDAVEWMVHNRINPSFPRKDGIYEIAFRRLNNEVQGLSLSKFISSSWKEPFVRALSARPHLLQLEIEREQRANMFETMKCEACNRRHIVTWRVQFKGKPYHLDTLEDVSDGEDSDSEGAEEDDEEDEEVQGTHDREGREIPRADRWFFLGRFCKANAESAHTLIHWRFHLNEWVVDHLEQKGYMDPEQIVQRAKWSNNKRRDHANEIVDVMEQEGEIRNLWRDFRANLEAAREAKTDPYGR